MAKPKKSKVKTNPVWTIFAVLGIIFVGGMLLTWTGFVPAEGGGFMPSVPTETVITSCPNDGDTTLTLTVQNILNTTGIETYDVAGRLNMQTVADTTAGSYTINCGEEYELSLLASDSDGGDNSKILSILSYSGMVSAPVIRDGKVVFTPNRGTVVLTVGSSQHGTMESRWYDLDAAGWIYNGAPYDNDGTDYEATGVIFQSTVNATAKAVGTNGELNYRGDIRADSIDEEFCDYYCLFLAEAPVATWQAPILKVDGITLTDAKGTLTTNEEKLFSSYEYIYKYNGKIDYNGVSVEYKLRANSGVDPSTNPDLDIAGAGNFLSVDGTAVKNGAASDDSTSTIVYTRHDIEFNIS